MSLSLETDQTNLVSASWVRPNQLATPKSSTLAVGTWTLTAILIAVMIVEASASTARVRMLVEDFGLRSAIWSWTDPSSYSRMVTYSLLHSDAGHFFWNSILLLLVGTLIERRIGLRAIGILFLAGASFAALSHLLMFPDEARPFIGSSGIVSTLFGVAVVIAGGVGLRIRVPGSMRWFSLTLRRLMLFWFGTQVVGFSMLFLTPGTPISVAYWAHLAGFLVGVAGGLVYRRMTQPVAEPESIAAMNPSFASAGD